MLKSKKRWSLVAQENEFLQQLITELQLTPLVAQLLVNRGITSIEDARNFLFIEKMSTHHPFLMKGMEQAVERIKTAIAAKENILIFGDYDADGVSSTAVLVHTLKELGANVDYYIPNRFTEGYGPNEPALRKAKENGFSLVVTVDTGISAVYEASVAKLLNLDFIITDHHEPPPVLPDAYAIVNPKQHDCRYPFKGLAGVGVALKLAEALLGKFPEHLLDIAVIGTIADLVPLIDENRLIVKKGIKALEKTTRPGLVALKSVIGLMDKELHADHVGFGIGPRINAAGRLDSAIPAVQLLISEETEEAQHLAAEIDELNKTRQGIVNEITEEAIALVEKHYASLDDHKVLIIAKEGWNAGVIGIVASRLVERYYRPTIVLTVDHKKGIAKGSARSIEGFDMFENLSASRDILPHFGGHPMAAGLTMNLEDVDTLRTRLNGQAAEILTEEDFIPITKVDLVVPINEINVKVIEEMNLLAPFGVSNPTPKVLLEDVSLAQMKRIGSEENHLKMLLEQDGQTVDCIGFHCGHLYEEISMLAKLSVLGTLSINEWNGNSKAQLMLEDISVKHWQLFDLRGNKHLNKNKSLPKEKVVGLYFNEQTKAMIDWPEEFDFIYISKDSPLQKIDLQRRYVFFLDLPYEKQQIEYILEQLTNPERIYAVFHHQEDHFFSTIPSREHFKWFYAFLAKQGSFHLEKHGLQLAKHKGWTKDTIDFMVQVFFELEFVTINNGFISLLSNIEKKELNQSKTYKRKQEQANLENELYYSSYHELKAWFQTRLQG